MKIKFTQEQMEYGDSGKTEFELIPDGHYLAKVHKATIDTFGSGNKGLVVDFILTDGEWKNRHVFDRYPFVKNSMWKLYKLLKSCGIEAKPNQEIDVQASDIVGANVKLNIGSEESYKPGDDRVFNKVKFIDPPPGGVLAGHTASEGLNFE